MCGTGVEELVTDGGLPATKGTGSNTALGAENLDFDTRDTRGEFDKVIPGLVCCGRDDRGVIGAILDVQPSVEGCCWQRAFGAESDTASPPGDSFGAESREVPGCWAAVDTWAFPLSRGMTEG